MYRDVEQKKKKKGVDLRASAQKSLMNTAEQLAQDGAKNTKKKRNQ